jgi:hypothetical protein
MGHAGCGFPALGAFPASTAPARYFGLPVIGPTMWDFPRDEIPTS